MKIIKFITIFLMIVIIGACDSQSKETNYEMNFHGREITPVTGNVVKSYIIRDINNKKYELSLFFESIDSTQKAEENLSIILKSEDNKQPLIFENVISGPYLSGRVPLPRAEFTKQNHLMVYLESWRTAHVLGYINGTLAWTDIVELNLEQVKIVNRWMLGENEFIITHKNNDFYIYNLGQVYTRNIDSWATFNIIKDLGLSKIKAEDIRTLFFEVSKKEFNIFKSQEMRLYGEEKNSKAKELMFTFVIP